MPKNPGSGKSSPGKQSKIRVTINQQIPGIKEVNFTFKNTFLKLQNTITLRTVIDIRMKNF